MRSSTHTISIVLISLMFTSGLLAVSRVAGAEFPGVRQASIVGNPSGPAVIDLDLSTLPRAPPWKPGDAIVQAVDLEGGPPPISLTGPSVSTIGQAVAGSGQEVQSSSNVDPNSLLRNFDGIPASLTPGNFAIAPPDTMGAVGPHHYMQVVNVLFAIFDKAGNRLAGPTGINCIWRGTPDCSQPPPDGVNDACEAGGFSGFGDGDPDVLYDHLADRWLISQFVAFSHQCIAVSRTGDPVTGGWFAYDFPTNGIVNDYPKFGIWPDAYYMGTNCFYPCGTAWAFDRASMLTGGIAAAPLTCSAEGGGPFMLPSDLDGPAPPPGAPNVFARSTDGAEFGGADRVQLMEFKVDWSTHTGTCTDLPDLAPPGLVIDRSVCGLVFFDFCLSQPGTTNTLEAATAFSMFRLQYRNFGTYQTLVFDHTVDADGAGRAGVQWFELRKLGGVWSIFQQGTQSPDATHRWMGSVAMDKNGNIAMGYSVTSTTVFPGLRYAGRLGGDPLGTMPQGEFTLVAGGASQTFNCPTGTPCQRWGDYATMSVDPSDGCTFWFTSEYIPNATSAWVTRIGAFRLGDCISVDKFFTDSDLNPLPVDQFGNPKVDVVLSNGVVRSTNPGQVLAWVRTTNTGPGQVMSLSMSETLPVDWKVSPKWLPAKGAIHVFFQFTAGTLVEITNPTTITVTNGNPQTVSVMIPDISATAAGKGLDPGESILLSVKTAYGLVGTPQSLASYPRTYTDTASASAWTDASFTGAKASDGASGFFIAFAKPLG